MRDWIDLFEYKMFEVEYYLMDRTFWENPTLLDLKGLITNHDLRGQSDGKNFFVWDAAELIHRHGAEAVAKAFRWEGETTNNDRFERANGFAEPLIDYDMSCYFYSPERTGTGLFAQEWIEEGVATQHYQLCPGLAVAFPTRGTAKLLSIGVFRNLMRHATLLDNSK